MKQIKFKQNFGRCYKQYVEYFNQLSFSQQSISFLFLFQLIQVSAALLPEISTQEPIKTLSLMGVHNFLGYITDDNKIVELAVPIVIFGLLCSTVIIPIHIAFESYSEQLIKNGTFKKIFQFSNTHKIIRYFLTTFQFTTLPVSLLFLSNNTQIYITIIASILIFIIAFSIDYHSLELTYHSDTRLIKVNFPNKLIDTAILICTIIVMGSLSGILKFIVMISCNLLRYLLLCKFKVFTDTQQLQQRFFIVLNQTLVIGLMVSYLVTQKNVALMITLILIWVQYTQKEKIKSIFASTKISKFTQLSQQQIIQDQLDNNECSPHLILTSIQQQFQKRGNFAGLFRKLIFLGNKNISYRQNLAITVLKSKCYQIQINSRGSSARILDCQTVMKYQQLLKQIICQVLLITDKTIQILMLIQKKEEHIYTFNKMVQSFHMIISKIKKNMVQLMHINQWSFEGQAIINLLFCNINKDYEFLEEIREIQKRNQTQSSKKLKIQLFNEKTVMVFVNMLDEIGKIVKTSKNLPTILGYNPHQLQGIDVDSILLPSMKVHHINNLTRFINNYDKAQAMSQRTVLFYMNNNNYQLQKVDVGYNLVMSSFYSFMVCGIIKKAYQDGEVIILNSEGNIEGCTKKLGYQLGLNKIFGPKMNRFNVLSLIPSLIKYGNKDVIIKTIIFKVKNMQNSCTKYQALKAHSEEERGRNNSRLFAKLLEDDIVQGYYSLIKVNNYCFFSKKVPLQEIVIKNICRITNFENIKQKILNKLKENEELIQGSLHQSQQSIQIQQQGGQIIFDTNFSLQPSNSSFIKFKQLQLCDIIDQQDENFLENDQQNINKQIVTIIDQSKNRNDHSQKAKIEKSWKLIYILLIVIAILLGLVVADFIYLTNKAYQMEEINQVIIHANKALSIILKFIFNPYQQGLQLFQNNHLLNPKQQLASKIFPFTTSYNKTILYSDFFLFNVHIPSLLNKILSKNTESSQKSKLQLKYNINRIIHESDEIFKLLLELWYTQNDDVKNVFYMKLVLFIVGSLIFLFVGFFMILAERKQLKSYQAFFKFRKEDLLETVENIKRNIKQLEKHSIKWYLDKQFDSYVKEGDLNNLQFQNINKTATVKEPKMKYEQGNKMQQSIKSKLFYRFFGYFIVLIASQAIYLIIFTIQTNLFLQSLRNTPTELNTCSKLIITPQYLLATLKYELQTQTLKKYLQVTKECISQPIATIPNLFHFISTQPCKNCSYLYPLLATSYVSFYNSFQAMIFYNKQANQSQYAFEQMVKGASLVSENIYQQLQLWTSINPSYLSPICYVISIVVILVLTLLNFKKINEETIGVQSFLQLFDKEMIEKNKLLVNLLDKKQ